MIEVPLSLCVRARFPRLLWQRQESLNNILYIWVSVFGIKGGVSNYIIIQLISMPLLAYTNVAGIR
jgi:hypothetical protein